MNKLVSFCLVIVGLSACGSKPQVANPPVVVDNRRDYPISLEDYEPLRFFCSKPVRQGGCKLDRVEVRDSNEGSTVVPLDKFVDRLYFLLTDQKPAAKKKKG
jgi:hypothetical protein